MNESLLDEKWHTELRRAREQLAAISLSKSHPYTREASAAVGFAHELLDMLVACANRGEEAPKLFTTNADDTLTLRGALGITWKGVRAYPMPGIAPNGKAEQTGGWNLYAAALSGACPSGIIPGNHRQKVLRKSSFRT